MLVHDFFLNVPKKFFFFVVLYLVAENVLEHTHRLEGSVLKLQPFIPKEPPEVKRRRLIEPEFSLFSLKLFLSPLYSMWPLVQLPFDPAYLRISCNFSAIGGSC